MLYGGAELHNVQALMEVEGRPGMLMQRVPEAVRTGLSEKGAARIRRAAAIEIRFASEPGTEAAVTLASYNGTSKVQLFYGDYWVRDESIGEVPKRIVMPEPEPYFQFAAPWSEDVPRRSFGAIWRIVVHGFEAHLIELEGTNLRPPLVHEKPRLSYLAYGTSITFGISAVTPDVSYVGQTAWRLGADAINLGMPGSAYCEEAMAEHIAARADWDIASLCISVNMLNQGVTTAEFAEKAEAMVRRIASAHPTKPIVCISLFPSAADFGWARPGRELRATSDSYRSALKDIAENSGFANVHYVDGRDLLDGYSGLSHDLLHPGNVGMIQIGERLAALMRPLLSGREPHADCDA